VYVCSVIPSVFESRALMHNCADDFDADVIVMSEWVILLTLSVGIMLCTARVSDLEMAGRSRSILAVSKGLGKL